MKLRVFYRKSTNEIVWNSTTDGEFPYSTEQDIEKLPNTKPDGETPIGGTPEDYSCLVVEDKTEVDAFLASDDNTVVTGKLVSGLPRQVILPEPAKDVLKELDALKARIEVSENK